MKKKVSHGGTGAQRGDFEALVDAIVQIHHQAQAFATKAVNVGLTLRNWLIGRQIEVYERQGVDRTAYGDKLMDTLAKRLVQQGWARCERRELYRFRQFYLTYPGIVESLTPQSLLLPELSPLLALVPSFPVQIRESATPESQIVESLTPQLIPAHPELIHRLSFTHLSELIQLSDDTQRRFYEIECIRGNWSVRELRRQIDSLYYERSATSSPSPTTGRRRSAAPKDGPDIGAIMELAASLNDLHKRMAANYAPIVQDLIQRRCRDQQQIEHTLDRLLDCACIPEGLALFKSLCRYYYTLNPAATADYVYAYRDMWDSEEDSLKAEG